MPVQELSWCPLPNRSSRGRWAVVIAFVLLASSGLALGVGALSSSVPSAAPSTHASSPSAALPTLNAPAKGYQSAMVDDSAGGYVLLFGGSIGSVVRNGVKYGETWIYESGTWRDITPSQCTYATCPRVQSFPEMAYFNRSGQQYVVMVEEAPGPASHWYFGNTWIFNGTWHNVTPTPLVPFVNSPPFYRTGSMTWDPTDGYSLLFGGCATPNCCVANCTSPLSYQTWAFTGISEGVAQWKNLTTSIHPPGMRNFGLTYDGADGYVLLFGGAVQGPPPYGLIIENLTWTYTGASGWVNRSATNFTATNTPPALTEIDGQLAYDPAVGSVVLFGGMHFWGTPTAGDKTANATLNVTWTYRAGEWTNVTGSPSRSPRPRFAAVMAFNPSDDSLLLFGGIAGTQVNIGFLGDTWWLGGEPLEWTNHTAGYSLKFTESGLPRGTTWSASVNGRLLSSPGTIEFVEPNGSYTYSISPISGYRLPPGGYVGQVTVNGADPSTITVHWTTVTYTVKFTEMGLPSGTAWQVTIDGKVKTGMGSAISFSIPNGTYAFTVSSSGYSETSQPSGSLAVDGAAVDVAVTFDPV